MRRNEWRGVPALKQADTRDPKADPRPNDEFFGRLDGQSKTVTVRYVSIDRNRIEYSINGYAFEASISAFLAWAANADVIKVAK